MRVPEDNGHSPWLIMARLSSNGGFQSPYHADRAFDACLAIRTRIEALQEPGSL
jgi:hypothetical protein